jgi:hypothetical protein
MGKKREREGEKWEWKGGRGRGESRAVSRGRRAATGREKGRESSKWRRRGKRKERMLGQVLDFPLHLRRGQCTTLFSPLGTLEILSNPLATIESAPRRELGSANWLFLPPPSLSEPEKSGKW